MAKSWQLCVPQPNREDLELRPESAIVLLTHSVCICTIKISCSDGKAEPIKPNVLQMETQYINS